MRNKESSAKLKRLATRLPRWRVLHCSECGDELNVREDIPAPVMCDACELGGPLFR